MKPDHNNPLAVVLPYNFTNGNEYPTEVLAARFLAWRVVLKDIVTYLREDANVQEEIVRPPVLVTWDALSIRPMAARI